MTNKKIQILVILMLQQKTNPEERDEKDFELFHPLERNNITL